MTEALRESLIGDFFSALFSFHMSTPTMEVSDGGASSRDLKEGSLRRMKAQTGLFHWIHPAAWLLLASLWIVECAENDFFVILLNFCLVVIVKER